MKIIDEKGRLFGKINVIDFLVILFLLCLTPMFYFGYKIYNKPVPVPVPREIVELEIDCTFIKLKNDILGLITVGDKEVDESGNVVGELIQVSKTRPYQYVFNMGDGMIVTKENFELNEIPVKLKLKAEVKDESLYYKDKPIKSNSVINFKTDKYNVMTLVKVKEAKEVKEKRMCVKIGFLNLINEAGDAVRQGDAERDKDGKVIGTINTVISKKSSEDLALNEKRDKYTTVINPRQKNITAVLELLCIEKEGGILYYKDYPIRIGNNITFTTDLYSISGTILGIEDNENK